MIETLCFQSGVAGSIPGGELRSHMPCSTVKNFFKRGLPSGNGNSLFTRGV